MTKLLVLLLVLFLTISAGCRREDSGQSPVQKTSSHEEDLTIVATNDFHASLDKAEGLASVIRDLRKRYGNKMIYLDAGDQFQGSIEGNISKGRAVIEFFNLVGVDAAALGNHEFDYGPNVPDRVSVKPGEDGMGNLKERLKNAKYPFLASNFIYKPNIGCTGGPRCNALGQSTVLEPRILLNKGGQKVCVIGATTPVTEKITNPDFIRGKQIVEIPAVLQAEAKHCRETEKADWVVLVAHEGVRYERDGKTFKDVGLAALVRKIPKGTVDAIVGGHSHLEVQQVIHGTPIVQAGTRAKVVGVMHLRKTEAGIRHRFDSFIPVPDTAVAFDVTRKLALYREEALDLKRKSIGLSHADFILDKNRETPLGNLVADALRDAGKQTGGAQFALMNAGGIRSPLPRGRITYDHVFRLMPFNDNLVVAELTGTQLTLLLEIAFSGVLGMPSVSGLRVTCLQVDSSDKGLWERDLNEDGRNEIWERDLVTDVRDEMGRPLNPAKTYKLATIDYLSDGGDYHDFIYDQIDDIKVKVYGTHQIRDVLGKYFEKRSPLRPLQYYSPSAPRVRLITP